MADREKVIKELEEVKEYIRTRSNGSGSKICRLMDVCNAAIILLKEQEAIAPIRDANSVRIFRCGACGEYVGFIDSDPEDPNEQDNYCRNCGRKVKWDG